MATTDVPDGTARRPYLVVARVGDSSLHPTWTEGERNFDLAVDYYGSTPGRWAGTAEHYFESKGSKWRGLHRLLTANPHLLDGYRAVWFPDDDIATDAATVSAVFDLHAELGMGLSQPSLTLDSYYTHLMTLSHPGFALRVTNFVEVMVPVFSREALLACLPTFDESESGFGLDLVWQSILPGLGLRSAIFDCLSVRHTRPLGSGTLYDGMTELPRHEGARVARAHGMPTPFTFLTLEALDASFRRLTGTRAEELIAANPPRPTVQEDWVWDLYLSELVQRVRARATAPDGPAGLPVPGLVRPIPLRTAGSGAASLERADPGRPLVLVVGADGEDRALAWRAAGWQTVLLPAGQPDLVTEHLALAEGFPRRAVDLDERSGHVLERLAGAAHRAGCAVVTRATAASLRCEHQLPDVFRQALGRCPACDVEWRSTGRLSDQVVAADAELLDVLADRAVPGARGDLDLTALRPAIPGGTSADGITVVVLSRGHDLGALLRTLADQRGRAGALEVVVVPAGALVPAPRGEVPAGLDLRTVDRPGAEGLRLALAEAGSARVLLLDSADRPVPEMLQRHAALAAERPGAVVLSRGRSPLLGPEDLLTQAVQDVDLVPPPGLRASAPTALARRLAEEHEVATAHAAAALLATAAEPLVAARPTHTAEPLGDLDAVRRSTVLAVLAAASAAGIAPRTRRSLAAELTHWSQRGRDLVAAAQKMAGTTAGVLRSMVAHRELGARGVELLGDALGGDLAAHGAAAALAVTAVQESARRGEPFTVAAAAADERLLPTLVRLASSDVERGALRLRVVLRPEDDPQAVAADLTRRLADAGASADQLPDIELQVRAEPAHQDRGAQVVLSAPGEHWFPGYPVPLLGLEPSVWLTHLTAAAVRARGTADHGAAPSCS